MMRSSLLAGLAFAATAALAAPASADCILQIEPAYDTWRIERARLGAVAGIDTGTRGTIYFDAFESRRQSYIGP